MEHVARFLALSIVFVINNTEISERSEPNVFKVMLKVHKKIFEKHGAVSIQCCLAMVNNLSKISKSKICVSITGIAGPKGGSKHKPVGLVFIGIKIGKKVIVNKCNFKNKGRSFIQRQAVKKTLNLVIKLIS